MRDAATTALAAARLLRNGLRFRLLRLTGRPGRPQAVSLEVTHRCVCRCVMCNIWRIPESVLDLSTEEWLGILSSDLLVDLRELDITGGEPFLRDDLVALIGGVCELKRSRLRRLRSIAITTNGVLGDRVVDMTARMLEPLRAAGVGLVIVCALDAVDETHDSIRRYDGAWRAVDGCIAGLMKLRAENPELIIGIKTTVLPENVGRLDQIAAYAAERGLFTIISPAIVTSGRYLNPDRAPRVALEAEDREALAQFYEGSAFRWSYHAGALVRFLRTGIMRKPCSCGFNYLFVRSTGAVHLCPLLPDSVGQAGGPAAAAAGAESGALNATRDQAGGAVEHPSGARGAAGGGDLRAVFASREARRARARLGRSPECSRCTEPGLERYSLPYEGFAYLRALFHLGPRAFLELHRHLGLDKYV